MATTIYHKFWTERWQTFVETNDVGDIFTTMVSQTVRAFGVVEEAKAQFRNLQSKNRGFTNKTSQAKKTAKKAMAEMEALRKSQVESL